MLIIILPAPACRLTTNKLPDEATLSLEQEKPQAENTPQIHLLNEESGGSKGEMEFFGGGYDIPTMGGAVESEPGKRYEFAFGADQQIWEDASRSIHVRPGKSIRPFLLVHASERRASKEQALMLADVLEGSGLPCWGQAIT